MLKFGPVVWEEMIFKDIAEKILFSAPVNILFGGTEPFVQFGREH